MKKEDKLVTSVRNLRSAIRARIREETLSEYEEARKEGKYPWEGMWLTPEQITRAQEKLKKKDKIVLFELLGLFFILIFFVLPTFANLTVSLMPRQNGKDYKKISKGDVQQFPSSPSNHDDDRKSPGALSSAEKSGGPLKRVTTTNSGKKGPQTDTARDDKYFIQIGAWKKLCYARKTQEKLKVKFPDVFIENRNHMYMVRIPEISGEEQGSIVLKEIKENFKFTPLLVRKK